VLQTSSSPTHQSTCTFKESTLETCAKELQKSEIEQYINGPTKNKAMTQDVQSFGYYCNSHENKILLKKANK
jgi:hypothetical protein